MKLKCSKLRDEEDDNEVLVTHEEEEETEILSNMSVEYEPLGVNRRRNPNVSAEILGGFHSRDGVGSRYAICTLDGTIMLGNENNDDNRSVKSKEKPSKQRC